MTLNPRRFRVGVTENYKVRLYLGQLHGETICVDMDVEDAERLDRDLGDKAEEARNRQKAAEAE